MESKRLHCQILTGPRARKRETAMTYTHDNQKINTPRDIGPIIQAILNATDYIEQDQEHFFVIGLDGGHKIKFIRLASMGLVDQTPVHPREVFRAAITDACSAVIIAHNHPSGSHEPSKEDTECTQRLKVAGEIIGIEVLDHVILAGNYFYSFAEHSLM